MVLAGILPDSKLRNSGPVWARGKARIFQLLQRLARAGGLDLQPHRGPPRSVGQFLASRDFDLVLDVGASTGNYAWTIRSGGYEGRICSFEPLTAPFARLEKLADGDPQWSCLRLALGSEPGEAQINVAGNSDSSSLLEMGERHARSDPDSVYVGTETIQLSTVDEIWDRVVRDGESVFLKLDVQGFELEALRGAERSLPRIAGVQAELSLVPLYEGAPEWTELIAYLQERGFHPERLETAFEDPQTGEVLQVDAVFIR
jgi:FkbM family methyltransferase